MAMNREDLMEKTFSLEDQIRYFKSHENELEKRIMLLLESDSFFFTTLSEVDMKARDIQKYGPPIVSEFFETVVENGQTL